MGESLSARTIIATVIIVSAVMLMIGEEHKTKEPHEAKEPLRSG